ncbi:glycoside hydrolase family 140 protein [Marinilabilia salmonicolor]|uniref:glycoside hydrolase family 140 protein n=2 Tax=Marinilabilia salmonicolor TaxID=989 RepID=UPI00029B08B0|nr:glycoside hydrolase family 140 protein [Marinilabilia salmonicolor]
MKRIVILLLIGFLTSSAFGQSLPLLKISEDKRHFVTQDNEPFFWLGGTAWELIHRLTKDEIDLYLTDRAEKGFTVIQTVVLAELDGLNTPNAYGEKPLINNNPEELNPEYFELVDYVIEKSEELGLYVGLLPTWGDKFNKGWGVGPVIFNEQNAKIYGEKIAKRYLNNSNVIWILGGDRAPETKEHSDIIRAMAKGIRNIDSKHLITYHPPGGNNAIDYFNEEWLDFDMFQSGHSKMASEYQFVAKTYEQSPDKPVINGEARYENIEDRFWENKEYGWLDDADVRVSAYWSMLTGAAGYTYGCNDIWQMYDITRSPNLQARTDWKVSLSLPGSEQMGFMKDILEMFDWQSMVYDPSLIVNENIKDESHIIATIGENKDFILAYTPTGKTIELDVSRLEANTFYSYWFNPRSGTMKLLGENKMTSKMEFKPWADGWGSDFLLIVTKEKLNMDNTKSR